MTEPRSSPSNPDPMDLERRQQEEDNMVTSAGLGGAPAGGSAAIYGDESARTDAYAASERLDSTLNAGGMVEPAAVQPGGIPTAAIVTVVIVIILLLILIFWLF